MVAVERKVPGRARPAAQVLAEYEEARALARQRGVDKGMDLAVVHFLVDVHVGPPPERVARWRVELACGCRFEVITRRETTPAAVTARDVLHEGVSLPPGQLFCRDPVHRPGPGTPHWRVITDWKDRREVTLPADPVEPEYGMEPEVWAQLRRAEDEQRAAWTVTLACGHVDTVHTDLEWRPGDGWSPSISQERRDALLVEIDEHDLHTIGPRSWIEACCPRPKPWADCAVCRMTSEVVGYQSLGPVKADPTQTAPAKKPASQRRRLADELAAAERKAAKLREQLADLPAEEAED